MTQQSGNQDNKRSLADRQEQLEHELVDAALERLAGDVRRELWTYDSWYRFVATRVEVAERDEMLAEARQAIGHAQGAVRLELAADEAYRRAFWQRPEVASRLPADEWAHFRGPESLDERGLEALDGYPMPNKREVDRERAGDQGPDIDM